MLGRRCRGFAALVTIPRHICGRNNALWWHAASVIENRIAYPRADKCDLQRQPAALGLLSLTEILILDTPGLRGFLHLFLGRIMPWWLKHRRPTFSSGSRGDTIQLLDTLKRGTIAPGQKYQKVKCTYVIATTSPANNLSLYSARGAIPPKPL